MNGIERRLKEIKARLEAATPGPWFTAMTDFHNILSVYCSEQEGTISLGSRLQDAEFIAHAPQDLAMLIEAYDLLYIVLEGICVVDRKNPMPKTWNAVQNKLDFIHDKYK